jgi:hypothetical protein
VFLPKLPFFVRRVITMKRGVCLYNRGIDDGWSLPRLLSAWILYRLARVSSPTIAGSESAQIPVG